MKNKIIGLVIILISFSILIFIFIKDNISNNIYQIELENKLINKEEYFALLEIPNINLKRELYEISDEKNNVDKNILVHEKSIFPKSGNDSHIILASHSGNGSNAYFKNLYKLKTKDIVNIYYDNKIYEYIIREIEYQNKTGELYLKQDYKNMLTLITCTYNNKETQTIYYLELQNTSNIS